MFLESKMMSLPLVVPIILALSIAHLRAKGMGSSS